MLPGSGMSSENIDRTSSIEKVKSVLDRRVELEAFSALVAAVKSEETDIALQGTAIVLDATVLLRIPGHKKSSDIIDYLSAQHSQPIVIPGQVVQEFWNNQFSVISTVYRKLERKHQDFSKEVDKAIETGILGAESIKEELETFRLKNEHVFDQDLIRKTVLLFENLSQKAIIPFAPREEFYQMSVLRKRSKTPPGFKDDGDGDFLVWIDLLWGLLCARSKGADFTSVVLLSNDEKIDWCRGNTAHPILAAEIRALLDVHFEVWTLDHFASKLNT